MSEPRHYSSEREGWQYVVDLENAALDEQWRQEQAMTTPTPPPLPPEGQVARFSLEHIGGTKDSFKLYSDRGPFMHGMWLCTLSDFDTQGEQTRQAIIDALNASVSEGPSPRPAAPASPEGIDVIDFARFIRATACSINSFGDAIVDMHTLPAMLHRYLNKRAAPHPAAPGAGEVTEEMVAIPLRLIRNLLGDLRAWGFRPGSETEHESGHNETLHHIFELEAALAARAGRE